MSDHFLHRILPAAAVAATAALLMTGCGTVDSASNRLVSAITPYKIEIVQGNFVSKEQVAALEKGMSRIQVREVLGTPLISNLFRGDRWDYVFTIKRPGVEPQSRRLSLFFEKDILVRFEGDEMPTEAEFVATLDTRTRIGRVPRLEATPSELAKFPGRPAAEAAAATAAVPVEPPSAVTYPPLNAPTSR